MLPECLQNFIGITRDCNNMGLGKSTSDLYVTDLEGLDVEVIADFTSNDATAQKLIERKIEFAINMVFEDLDFYIQPYFSTHKIVDKVIKGTWTTEVLPISPIRRGLHVKKNQRGFIKNTIEKVRILSHTTQVGAILRITDGIYQTDYVINLVADQILEVLLNYDMIFDECYITLDNTSLEMYKVNLQSNTHNSHCSSCGHGNYNDSYRKTPKEGVLVTGWDGLQDHECSFGMYVEILSQCDFDVLKCSLANRFKTLFLYRVGIELCKQWIHSPRVNETTVLNVDHGYFLIQEWGLEYDKKFKVAVNGIRAVMKSFEDICITCNEAGYKYQI